ncbi:MAG: hypothetical protein WCW54_00530 [Candidatus Paceibacterota bacterium]
MKNLKRKKYSILGNILKLGPILVLGFILLSPVAFAIKCNGVETTATTCPAGVKVDAGIKNPLGENLDTIPKFIEAIINIVLVVGIPILALAIIYAGFLYVKAQGNPSELEIAHRTLLYTVIGGALLLGAYVIAQAIGSTVKDITNGA